MRSRRISILVIYLSFLVSCQPNEKEIMPVAAVLGKNQEEVKAQLGKPDSIFNKFILEKKLEVFLYEERLTHVRFFRNRAEEIIIYNPIDLPFEPRLITKFGFEYLEPARSDSGVFYNWPKYDGSININIYSVGRRPYKGFEEHPGFEIYFSKKK